MCGLVRLDVRKDGRRHERQRWDGATEPLVHEPCQTGRLSGDGRQHGYGVV